MSEINREIWNVDSFSTKKPHPPWQCPICNQGTLHGDKNTLKIEQSQDTIKASKSYNYPKQGEATFRFAGFMVCNNLRCNEKIGIVGKGVLYTSYFDRPASIQVKAPRYSVYFPKYFEPALNIFQISDYCPPQIKNQIEKSFSHFFNDLNASANAIRTSLELIMDEQGISNKNEIGSQIYLGPRIEKFNDLNPELKPFIEAAKWIGNAGSHVEDLDKNDLLDGYDLLQFVIHELYEKKARFNKLSLKATEINTSKKPLSKK